MIMACLAAFQFLPCEYEIDPGALRVPVGTELRFRFLARDGTGFSATLLVPKDAEPLHVRIGLSSVLADNMWMFRTAPGDRVIVSGSKDSPVRSVAVESDGWAPTVRWVTLPPKK